MERIRNQELETFLPDFCNIRIVFSVIIIGELLAIVLALAGPSERGNAWNYLSLVSLFIQWVALISTAALCTLRPYLAKLSNTIAGIIAYLLLLLITYLFSEIAYWLNENFGAGAFTINMDRSEFIFRNGATCAIASLLILRYFYLQYQLKRNIEAENQYRLQALQARIHPHFLFNSLNTIASLIRRRPKTAEEAVEDLADLFRHTLNSAASQVPFTEEMEITNRYLQIEKLRLDTRLNVEWQIETIPKDATLPSLTLQPLLENAIYHGIEKLADGGTIQCLASFDGNVIKLKISNPVNKLNTDKIRPSLSMAVDNISQRLQAYFGELGKLTIMRPDGYHQVELQFPYIPYNKKS